MINIIVCAQEDGGIGYQGDLIWKIPKDQAKFKELTMGCPVVMGRKTWESLPAPLEGRENIVLSRKPHTDCTNCRSVEQVLSLAEGSSEPVWIIGGAKVYEQFLPYADQLFLTHVFDTRPADTFFPELNWEEWELAGTETLCLEPLARLEIWRRKEV